MLKKIVACISAVLFILMSVITASADGATTSTGSSGAEHGGSSGSFGAKSWKADMWYKFFGDSNINENGEYKKYADDIFKSEVRLLKIALACFMLAVMVSLILAVWIFM